MKIESFRVENKDNIWFDGRKTIFTLYESKNGVWFRISNFMAEGYDASDEQCIEAGLVTLATLDTLSKAKEPKGKLESGLSKSEGYFVQGPGTQRKIGIRIVRCRDYP